MRRNACTCAVHHIRTHSPTVRENKRQSRPPARPPQPAAVRALTEPCTAQTRRGAPFFRWLQHCGVLKARKLTREPTLSGPYTTPAPRAWFGDTLGCSRRGCGCQQGSGCGADGAIRVRGASCMSMSLHSSSSTSRAEWLLGERTGLPPSAPAGPTSAGGAHPVLTRYSQYLLSGSRAA